MLNEEGQRALVTVRTIDEIHPIVFLNENKELETASAIERIVIGGWNCVVQKNRFNVGELCVYCEVDTILPPGVELFSFLEGKRIKTKKLKQVVSQGVVFQIPEILEVILKTKVDSPVEYYQFVEKEWSEGEDITELVGAIKYDEYSTKNGGDNSGVRTLPSDAKGKFPNFIPKTDEERIQNLGKQFKVDWLDVEVIEREKLHGSSITIYCKLQPSVIEGLPNILDYGICSRNLDLKLDSDTNFVKAGIPALKKLVAWCNATGESLAIQGELIGPSINGNPYKLKEQEIRFFTVYDIANKRRYTDYELSQLVVFKLSEFICPLVGQVTLDGDMIALLTKVEGKSQLADVRREGSVFRAVDGSFSFKAVSNDWLLHEK